MNLQYKEIVNSGLRREYDITLSSDDYKGEIEKEARKIAANISIDGFRKGKAPLNIVLKSYRHNIEKDLLNNLLSKSVKHIKTETNITPVVQPEVKDLKFSENEGFYCKILMEDTPKIDDINLSDIKITKQVIEVKDEDLQKEIDKILTLSRKYEIASDEYAANKDDKVWINFTGRMNGEEFSGGKGENYPLIIDSNTFIPGFEAQIKGMKKNETKTINVTFPENYHSTNMAGKDAEFDILVTKIEKPIMNEMNDEFAKQQGFESVEKMKETIKNFISSRNLEESTVLLKKDLFDILEKTLNFPLPEMMVDKQLNEIATFLARDTHHHHNHENNKEHGHSEHKCFDHLDAKTQEQAKILSRRRVKVALFFQKLIKDNNMTITSDELRRAVVNRAMATPNQAQEVFERYTKDQNMLEALQADLLEEKAVNFILEKANVTEQIVTKAEIEAKLKELDNII